MAIKRMFSKSITKTDAFLDMPKTSQLLYFHLGMEADDDGFVGNVKSVSRNIGASDDDMKILVAKRFILIFESGIIVIKHWKIHNYIQKDRYKETKYLDEKNQIKVKENGSYTECTQNVSRMDTQTRLGKVRLGKSKIATKVADWSYKDQINKMATDTGDPRMWIIALYWVVKNYNLQNKEEYGSALRRELRPAKELQGYPRERIKEVVMWLKENADFKWTLETVNKYISEDLGKLSKKNKKIINIS